MEEKGEREKKEIGRENEKVKKKKRTKEDKKHKKG